MCDLSRGLSTPAVRSSQTPPEAARRPLALRRASPFFCSDLLEHGVVEDGVGQQLLQLRVLVLERPQTLGLRHLEAAVLGFPLVERGTADPVLAAAVFAPASCSRKIPRICSSVNRLGFMSIPLRAMDSTHSWRRFRGSGHAQNVLEEAQAIFKGLVEIPNDGDRY